MRLNESKIDIAMRSYAKKWIKSTNQQRVSTTLGYFFVGLFILFWSSSITTFLGLDLKSGYGALFFVFIGISLTFITIYLNKLMAKIGLKRPIRSALFLSALIGPYTYLSTYNAWNLPVISHIAGFFASVLTFILCYLLDTFLVSYLEKTDYPDA
jgi:hypothetical protein